MNITGGVLAKSLESVYSIIIFFLNQTVHITPRLCTEGHALSSAMDYALLPSTAYAKSKAVNALDSTGAGRESVEVGGDATEGACSYAACCSIIVI